MIAHQLMVKSRAKFCLVAVAVLTSACLTACSISSAKASSISVSGNLNSKGSQPGAWWAVTDDSGRVWKLVSPTPEQQQTLDRSQNRRVTVEGQVQEKYLTFDQIKPDQITPAK